MKSLLHSSIAIMLVEFQGENKRKQEDKRNEEKWKQKHDQLEFYFQNNLFGHILKKPAQSLFDAWPFLLVHN